MRNLQFYVSGKRSMFGISCVNIYKRNYAAQYELLHRGRLLDVVLGDNCAIITLWDVVFYIYQDLGNDAMESKYMVNTLWCLNKAIITALCICYGYVVLTRPLHAHYIYNEVITLVINSYQTNLDAAGTEAKRLFERKDRCE